MADIKASGQKNQSSTFYYSFFVFTRSIIIYLKRKKVVCNLQEDVDIDARTP